MLYNHIHRIWLGGNMPEKFKQYGREFEDLNPGMLLLDWNDDDIFNTQWINQTVIDRMRDEATQPHADQVAFYTHVADVVDYELMYRYGGFYFNTDLKPLKPLSTLQFDETEPWLAMEDDIHPVNMAMYSPPHHPFFARVIELLPKRYFGMPGAFMNASTGVQLLQHAIATFGAIKTFHRNVFNPIHFTEFGYGEEPNLNREFPPETVAVHEWGHRTNQRNQRILEY